MGWFLFFVLLTVIVGFLINYLLGKFMPCPCKRLDAHTKGVDVPIIPDDDDVNALFD